MINNFIDIKVFDLIYLIWQLIDTLVEWTFSEIDTSFKGERLYINKSAKYK